MVFRAVNLKRVLLAIMVLLWVVACQSGLQPQQGTQEPKTDPLASSQTPAPSECRIIQHALGETCVPQQPERIAALEGASVSNLLSLGVEPIAVPNNLLPPIAEATAGVERLGQSSQINLEKLASLQPDLIIAGLWDVEQVYDRLSQIAPTVVVDSQTTGQWKEVFAFHAEVLGKQTEAKEVMADYAARVSEMQKQLGADTLAQTEVSLVRVIDHSAQIILYLKNCVGGSVLADVGFARPPSQNRGELDKPPFHQSISLEQVQQADGDVVFLWTFGATPEIAQTAQTELTALQRSPLWQRLNAVQQGRIYQVGHHWGALGSPMTANWVLDDISRYLIDQPQASTP